MPLIIPFFIEHRGCPQRCRFCNQWAIVERDRTRAADPAVDLQRTIDLWLRRSRYRPDTQVAFFGGSFTCLDEALQVRLLRTVAPFISNGSVASIRLSTRPDCINEEVCAFLRGYGVKTVELGVQSLSETVLERAGRGHGAADSRRAAGLVSAHGFDLGIQLMPGLPGETTASFLTGVREVIALAPRFVRLYPALVIRRTGLEQECATSSWRPLSLNRAVALTGRARELLGAHGIRVIRMGLQPSRELERELVDGPYHPAFGELVMGRSWYLKARRLLAGAGSGKTVTITISERDYSAFVGPGKRNIERLSRLRHGGRLVLVTDKNLEREQFRYVVS